jgi:hypothetical protein
LVPHSFAAQVGVGQTQTLLLQISSSPRQAGHWVWPQALDLVSHSFGPQTGGRQAAQMFATQVLPSGHSAGQSRLLPHAFLTVMSHWFPHSGTGHSQV